MSYSEYILRSGQRHLYQVPTNPYLDRDQFWFGNVNSLGFDIWISGGSFFDMPERDVEFESVQGRNGDLLIDHNRWKNVNITYNCAIMWEAELKYSEFFMELMAQTGYQKLEDSFHPDTYRMAMIKDPIKAQSKGAGKPIVFDVSFYCKPQRYFVLGDRVKTYSEPGTICNGYGYPAKPLITVYGSGAGTLTVGDTTVEIKSLTDQITLDCEMQNAYRKVGDGATENKNNVIYASDFPVLRDEKTEIRWSGGIDHIDIVPRWWTL